MDSSIEITCGSDFDPIRLTFLGRIPHESFEVSIFPGGSLFHTLLWPIQGAKCDARIQYAADYETASG